MDDPVPFFKLSLFILTAQSLPLVGAWGGQLQRELEAEACLHFEASWSMQHKVKVKPVSGFCFKGGALSSFSLSDCFTAQHLERQNMSASLPHRPLGRLRTALCAETLQMHLCWWKGHKSCKSWSEWHMGYGSQAVCP